jgi:hypothetical protein
MPRRKKRSSRGKQLEEYARVALRVNSYKVRAEAALNHNARNAEYAFRDTEDEPPYHFLAHVEIGADNDQEPGQCPNPEPHGLIRPWRPTPGRSIRIAACHARSIAKNTSDRRPSRR